MGLWIELGVFGLVFVFALHQWHDLKKEKRKREQQKAAADAETPKESLAGSAGATPCILNPIG